MLMMFFCIIKKGAKNDILNEMNKFDPMLKFTVENMSEDKLNFLDTTVCFEDNELILDQYRKPESTDCLINFKKGVSPKSYKISTLIGEIYRARNCTTTEKGLNRALETVRNQFIKNTKKY